MSIRRFPRMKIVRHLTQLEDELSGWIDVLRQQMKFERPSEDYVAMELKISELQVLASDLHSLAHRAAHMPLRNRDLLREWPER